MTRFIDTRNNHAHGYDPLGSFAGAFFFGPLYFLFKGMVVWFLIAFILNLLTLCFAWPFIAVFAPHIRKTHLLNQGFVIEKSNQVVYTAKTVQRTEPTF